MEDLEVHSRRSIKR